MDIVKLLTGKTGSQLKQEGRKLYPEENDPLNRTAHRLGAKILTERYGVVPAQLMGVGNEVYEAWNMRDSLKDPNKRLVGTGGDALIDLGDIGANVRGSLDTMDPATQKLVQKLAALFGRR